LPRDSFLLSDNRAHLSAGTNRQLCEISRNTKGLTRQVTDLM